MGFLIGVDGLSYNYLSLICVVNNGNITNILLA